MSVELCVFVRNDRLPTRAEWQASLDRAYASLDLDAVTGGRAGSRRKDFDLGNVSLGLLHNFNREFGNVPAFALRLSSMRGAVPIPASIRGCG